MFLKRRTTCSKYAIHSNLNSQHNREELYDHLMSTRIFILIILRYSYELQKQRRKWVHARIGFANHLARIVWFISYKKWVQRGECPSKACLPRTVKALYLTTISFINLFDRAIYMNAYFNANCASRSRMQMSSSDPLLRGISMTSRVEKIRIFVKFKCIRLSEDKQIEAKEVHRSI